MADQDKQGGGIASGTSDDTGGLITGADNDPERATEEGLAAVDPELADAIEGGAGGDASAAGVAGGKVSSESPGGPQPFAPDPGSPGGMGGVRARSRTVDNRPPGGVSPLSGSDDEG